VIATVHLRQAPDEPAGSFRDRAAAALRVLAARPGFLRGSLGRATDDEHAWLVCTEWESVGAYRRALGGYEVKLVATPLLAQALDQPSAFEQLLEVAADGSERERSSDRASDAETSARIAGS
jgi:hypothetical protein